MSLPATRRLADWICSLRYEDIPPRVLARTRHQLLSVLAAVHAGARTDAGAAVYRAVSKSGSRGPCTVVPSRDRMSLADAITINSAYSMALDYDDYLYMGHTGHSATLGSLAVCEAEGLSTRALITAAVIANEVGGRVGASAVLGPQNGQAWSFIHAIEGAALAARLYGLDVTRTAHALAIAMYQPTFTLWPGFMGPQSKLLTAAGPTVIGIQAAQLAREGMTGALDIFEHPRKGFWASFTYVPLPHMLSGFGSAWVSDTLAYKGYPGCAYIDTTMDALFAALSEARAARGAPLKADEVASIQVEASLLTVEMDNLSAEHVREGEPLSPINVNFSIPYNVGIGVVAGRHTAAELSQEFLDAHAPAIRRVAARTSLRHDWNMSAGVARAFDAVLGRSSALASLSPAQLARVVRGYRSQLGGRKKNDIDVPGLGRFLLRFSPDIVRLVVDRLRRRRGPGAAPGGDLSRVDFTKFEMRFPARVTLRTVDGEGYSARQDIPRGAPGQERYFETVEDKVRRESGRVIGGDPAERLLQVVLALEEHSLQDVISAACGSETGIATAKPT